MLCLPNSHPGAEHLLKSSGFSVSRSNVPFCRIPVDLSIEQPYNRDAKSKHLSAEINQHITDGP
jgi:hypothetical protein